MPLDLLLDFAHGLDPAVFAEDRLGFRPDPWQSQVLRSPARWILLNCCRQSGKSTTTALVALHTAIYDPGLILLVSPSLRQSKELFAKTAGFLKRLEPVEELEEDNKSSCTLEVELHPRQWCARRLAAGRPRYAAGLLRAEAHHQGRSGLCQRCDAGRTRSDARCFERSTDRDVFAQRQARAFLRELARRHRRRADQDHWSGMSAHRRGDPGEDAPETRANAVQPGVRGRVYRRGKLGLLVRDDRAGAGRRFRKVHHMSDIYQVGHLERMPLGTPYPGIVAHVGRLLGKLPDPELVIDYTGVGRPVFDLFTYAGISPVGVLITGGAVET